MKKKAVKSVLMIVITAVIVLGIIGCKKETYSVKFEDEWSEECFDGLKDSYEEGEKVRLYYGNEYIGTDTDYAFYLDDERLEVDYDEEKGYVITFKMPDHDVMLKIGHSNSMF